MTTEHCIALVTPQYSKSKKRQMSKTFIGGAICREFESEALAAEEMLDRIVCSREQFSDVA